MKVNSINFYINSGAIKPSKGSNSVAADNTIKAGNPFYDTFYKVGPAFGASETNTEIPEHMNVFMQAYTKVYNAAYNAGVAEFNENNLSMDDLEGRVKRFYKFQKENTQKFTESGEIDFDKYLDMVALKGEADAAVSCSRVSSVLMRSVNNILGKKSKSAKTALRAQNVIEKQKQLVKKAAEQEYTEVFSRICNDLREYPKEGLKNRLKLYKNTYDVNVSLYLQADKIAPEVLYECIKEKAKTDAILKLLESKHPSSIADGI